MCAILQINTSPFSNATQNIHRFTLKNSVIFGLFGQDSITERLEWMHRLKKRAFYGYGLDLIPNMTAL